MFISASRWMNGRSSARQTHQLADHARRQRRRDVVHELDVALRRGLGHDLATDLADLIFHVRDDARLEARRDRAAVVDVAGRIHRQQHVAHHLELLRREVLEHHAALARGEQVRLPRDVHDVGVLEHHPVAGLVGHLLEVHGLRAPQLREHFVRRRGDVGVGVVEIDDRH